MLRELTIKNIALIDDLTVSFERGMNVLTGETGAGKSIVVDSVSLILGGRGDRELIRAGCDRAYVEAVIEEAQAAFPVLEELGIECEEQLILTRELGEKNICRVNGRAQSLAALRQITASLVNLHGQNQLAEVFDEKNHLTLLDAFAGECAEKAAANVRESYAAYAAQKKALEELTIGEAERARMIDLYAFQCDEIDRVAPKEGEEEELVREKHAMLNAEKIAQSLNLAYENLSDGALGSAARARRALEEISAYDADYAKLAASIADAYYTLEDASYELGEKKNRVVYDEAELNRIEDRLAQLSSLNRKYGGTIANVLAYYDEIAQKLAVLQHSDESRAKLTNALNQTQKTLEAACEALSRERKSAAKEFEKRVTEQLADLGMSEARFLTEFSKKALAKDGYDQVRFLISVNRGEPERALAKVVSGGEAARIMLALKTISAERDGIGTVIFDEIDAGIGGRMANVVAKKLARIAGVRQVICVSHLSQIAAWADANFLIEKHVEDDRTKTFIHRLDEARILAELARLSGGLETDSALAHAKEMRETAWSYRKGR